MARRSAASSTAARRCIPLTEADIQAELDRRRPGQSRFTTQRREPDEVRILSGVFEDERTGGQVTTGTPIALMIENVDQRSKDYGEIRDKFRPGHADFTYDVKYGIRDYRGGGRSSARETACACRRRRHRPQGRAGPRRARRAGADGPAQRSTAPAGTGTRSAATRSSAPTRRWRQFYEELPRRHPQGGLVHRRGHRDCRRGRPGRARARRSTASSIPTSPPR